MTNEKKVKNKKCEYVWTTPKCRREALPGDEHCIFHSKDIEGKKDRFNEEFWKEFKRQKEHEEFYDFTGFVFPVDISFKEKTFEKYANFGDARFEGEANFNKAKFSAEAIFDKAKFSGEAIFDKAKFSGEAIFCGAQFSRKANFENAEFLREAGAYFRKAKFSGEASFADAKFSGVAIFPDAKFNRDAVFKNTEFYKKVDSEWDPQIPPVCVDFKKAEFSKKADFLDSKFTTASFRFTQFSGVAIFAKAEFSQKANFDVAKFSGEANFEKAQFLKDTNAYFTRTEFYGYSNFREAQFDGEVHFINAEFHGNVTFNSFSYCGKVNFREVKFYKEAEFRRPIAKADVNNLSFDYTYFFNVVGLFEYIEENKKVFKKIRKRSKTLKTEFLPKNFKLILGEATTARYPIISRKIRDDMYLLSFKKKHPKMHFIWWLFADCGRSFLRWAGWSLFFAFLFGLIYTPCFDFLPNWWIDLCNIIGPQFEQTSKAFSGQPPGFWSSLYFSIVTFTTLGFGDIVAANITARILVTFEVILGYIMLGGLISILANKLARRS